MQVEQETVQTADVEEEQTGESVFDVLDASCSIDEMDVYESENGTVYIQDTGETLAEVKQQSNALRVKETSPDEVNLNQMDEVQDVFGDQVMAE